MVQKSENIVKRPHPPPYPSKFYIKLKIVMGNKLGAENTKIMISKSKYHEERPPLQPKKVPFLRVLDIK